MAGTDGGPAFPSWTRESQEIGGIWTLVGGMTLRDYFAATTLQGISVNECDPKVISKNAYALADALLEERSK